MAVSLRRVTTCAGDFDDDILRIATAYDDLGRQATVIQYDNAAVGSGTAQDGVAFTYDDWGNLEMFEEDRNSAVSTGNDEYTVSYTFEKKTSGRNTVRRSAMTQPSGAEITYNYRVQAARFDDDVSRVTYLKHGETPVAEYQYNGLGQVVETKYAEPEVKWSQYGSTSGDYPDLDRFNRVASSRWTKDLATDVDFYDVDISYDENSNITVIEDNIQVDTGGNGYGRFDVDYSIDDVDRLTQAEEGTWGGSSITTKYRDEQWTLDHVGNWDVNKLDLNGDSDFVDTGELNDDRTHNDVNELTARDIDDDSNDDYSLSYDAAGNMTDDGESYKYEWDAFYRLRKVYNQSDELVAEHRYNGLGHRIGELVDTDTDGDVDGSDEWRFFAHDEQWRIVAHFMGSDTDPTEEYLFHAAGLDGSGGSSYIDLVVLRERDTTDNGTMDERVYYCQNWRADVSAIVDDSGVMQEWAKYSSYGLPFGLPAGDTDCDGDCDATDATQITAWKNAPAYDVRGDINLDGTVDASDEALVQSATLGRGNLSSVENRLGYAGYVWADSSDDYLVRHRVLSPGLGRWLSRDPLGYVDGVAFYQYVGSSPSAKNDPSGESSGKHCHYKEDKPVDNQASTCGGISYKIDIDGDACRSKDEAECPGMCRWRGCVMRFKMKWCDPEKADCDNPDNWERKFPGEKDDENTPLGYWHGGSGLTWTGPRSEDFTPNDSNPTTSSFDVVTVCSDKVVQEGPVANANCVTLTWNVMTPVERIPVCSVTIKVSFCCYVCGFIDGKAVGLSNSLVGIGSAPYQF